MMHEYDLYFRVISMLALYAPNGGGMLDIAHWYEYHVRDISLTLIMDMHKITVVENKKLQIKNSNHILEFDLKI